MDSAETVGVEVDVVEQCRVSPPPGSVTSPTSLPLTFFDIIWLWQPPVHRLFFYELPLSKTHFSNTILPKLKHSLSLTLQYFFPLAGNLAWPEGSSRPEILCTEGDSVAFSVAESRVDFHHLSSNHPRDANLFLPLVPELPRNFDIKLYPVLALQVTLFPNKGFCVGVTYHHSVADGRILIHFIKAWASTCRDEASFLSTKSLMCYDRSLVVDRLGIDVFYLDLIKKKANITKESFNLPIHILSPIQDKVLATYIIRPRDVTRIKQWVLANIENKEKTEKPMHLSTFVITCAYVWVCLVRATWRETAASATEDPFEYFLFPVDCRSRRKPPLPAAYFGNCLAANVVKVKRSELVAQAGFVVAAKLIGSKIQNGQDGDGFFKEDTFRSGELASAKDRVLSVAGSTKLGIYETHFGWGNLKKVEVPSIAMNGAMSLCEYPDEMGAVEVGLAWSKIVMDDFSTLFADTLQAFT